MEMSATNRRDGHRVECRQRERDRRAGQTVHWDQVVAATNIGRIPAGSSQTAQLNYTAV